MGQLVITWSIINCTHISFVLSNPHCANPIGGEVNCGDSINYLPMHNVHIIMTFECFKYFFKKKQLLYFNRLQIFLEINIRSFIADKRKMTDTKNILNPLGWFKSYEIKTCSSIFYWILNTSVLSYEFNHT